MALDDQMPYQQQWLERGTDRLGIQCYDGPGPDAPAVLIWPAMGVPARFYRPFALGLREAGLAVTVVDLRGTGASTPRPSRRSRYGYAELVDDVAAVLAELKPRLDGRRVLLLGHSLGGQVCLLHLAREGGAQIDGLVLVAAGLPYWRVFRGRGGLLVLPFTQGIYATASLLRVWPGWGFGGRQAHGVIRDWAYSARTGRFPRLAGFDAEAAVGTLSTPVLAISFERDQYTPSAIVDHLAGKLPAPVRREHYDGGADHFTWARTAASPVATRVAAFAHGG